MSSGIGQYTEAVTSAIHSLARESTQQFWTRTMKGVIPFWGTTMEGVRRVVLTHVVEIRALPEAMQWELASDWMAHPVAEMKLAAILWVQQLRADEAPSAIVAWCEHMFEQGFIFDWNTCDWLCMKLLFPCIQCGERPLIDRIAGWCDRASLWHARASVVPFAFIKSPRPETVHQALETIVHRPERFIQTAVGWLLREMQATEPTYVTHFLQRFGSVMSAEAIRRATERERQRPKTNTETNQKGGTRREPTI